MKKESPQIVASIDDLLIEIFLHLPLKPLIRFKLVSKHWNTIISSPRLCVLLNHRPNPAVALIYQGPYIIENPDLDAFRSRPNIFRFSKTTPRYAFESSHAYAVYFDKSSTSPPFSKLKFIDDWPSGARILNSCNGLLLCLSKSTHRPRYYVCNPTTNQYSLIPEIDEAVLFEMEKSKHGMILAFDPSKSHHYKVVRVLALGWRRTYKFAVYSSETGTWRKCEESFIADVDFDDGVYWNGAVHWISSTETGESIYFNPDHDQTCRVMPTPPIFNGSVLKYNRYLGESCGHLHYIDDYRMANKFDVYEMRRDYSDWFFKYRVDLSNIVSNLPYDICSVVRGKKSADSFLVLRIMEKFIRYNLVYETCGTICEFEGFMFVDYFWRPVANFPLQYIESLCSV